MDQSGSTGRLGRIGWSIWSSAWRKSYYSNSTLSSIVRTCRASRPDSPPLHRQAPVSKEGVLQLSQFLHSAVSLAQAIGSPLQDLFSSTHRVSVSPSQHHSYVLHTGFSGVTVKLCCRSRTPRRMRHRIGRGCSDLSVDVSCLCWRWAQMYSPQSMIVILICLLCCLADCVLVETGLGRYDVKRRWHGWKVVEVLPSSSWLER